MRSETTSAAALPVHRGIYNQIRATMDAGELRPGHLLSVMQVAKAFDVGKSAGNRATFLIDKEGKIVKAFPMVKDAAGHADEVLAYVKKHFK